MKTKQPNLYEFATKELAQDATLAYILAWADPEYKSYQTLHALGRDLLKALLETKAMPLPPTIRKVQVETQVNRIDILVRINPDNDANQIILLIEDKVNTTEHSNQIERYLETAEKKYGPDKNFVAVYLKTGNESQRSLPSKEKCGRFLRPDLLKVLDGHRKTDNAIVENFREHLQKWEDETNQWKSLSNSEKGWQVEGFYGALERELSKSPRFGWCGWRYVSNRTGGFLGFWAGNNTCKVTGRPENLYLQIHNVNRLTIRIGSGNGDKVSSGFMHRVFNALSNAQHGAFEVKKAGTFRGGDSAAVADISFGRGPWFAVDDNGINLDATVERLHQVQALLQEVAQSPELENVV